MTDLTCIYCSSVSFGSAENLRPVISTDGKIYDVACIHKLKRLKKWRELTPEERVDFNKMSDLFIEALKEAANYEKK